MSFSKVAVDQHGNDDVFNFLNLDFSKISLKEYKEEEKKLNEKIDKGHYRFKTTIMNGLVTVERETGSKDVYKADDFESLRTIPTNTAQSIKDKNLKPLNTNPSASTETLQEVAISKNQNFQTTATKVGRQIGTVRNAPPDFHDMVLEHERNMQRAVIEGKINCAQIIEEQRMDNPALVANAESLIQTMRNSSVCSDRDVRELVEELQVLLNSLEGCEVNKERAILLKEIDEKINECKDFFEYICNRNKN